MKVRYRMIKRTAQSSDSQTTCPDPPSDVLFKIPLQVNLHDNDCLFILLFF